MDNIKYTLTIPDMNCREEVVVEFMKRFGREPEIVRQRDGDWEAGWISEEELKR